MADLATLSARLAALEAARATGVKSVTYEGREVVYRSDAEMAAAVADLRRQIADAAQTRVGAVTFSSSKGL